MLSSGGLTPAIALPDRALTVGEVAAVFRTCHATVRREHKRGRLRGTRVGAVLRFMPADVLAYLDADTPARAVERADWDAFIRKLVADAPPLRPEQIAALSALLEYQPTAGGAA